MSIEELLSEVQSVPQEQLPHLIGQLQEAHAVAMARLLRPDLTANATEERLLSVEEAAQRLGTSTDYLYRHSKKLPFARRIGRKLLFSESGLSAYIRRGQR